MPSMPESTGGSYKSKSKSKKGGSSDMMDMKSLVTSTGGSSLKMGGEYEKAVGGRRRRKSSKRRSSKRRSSRSRSSKSRR